MVKIKTYNIDNKIKIGNKFTVIDIETPNKKNSSICSIALRNLENNNLTEKYYLVNPEDSFDDFNIQIHNITPKMVENKENFVKVWKEIEEFFYNTIIVAHNASFDIGVICKTLNYYNIQIPNISYIDTLEIFKKEFPDLKYYKLNNLCEEFNIELLNHHNAQSDTKACFELFEVLLKKKIDLNKYIKMYKFIPLSNKYNNLNLEKEINNLLGIIIGIVSDDILKPKELIALKEWIKEKEKCKTENILTKIIEEIQKILEEGFITKNEKIKIYKIMGNLINSKKFCRNTVLMQILFGIIEGITCDNELNLKEISFLKEWMCENDNLKGIYPYDIIFNKLNKILEDNIISKDEKYELLEMFKNCLNPITKEKRQIIFKDKTVCLTGNFSTGSKSSIEEKIKSMGGTVSKTVNKKINILIVGGEGSSDWSYGSYGAKVKRAKELIEKGSEIDIISGQIYLSNLRFNIEA